MLLHMKFFLLLLISVLAGASCRDKVDLAASTAPAAPKAAETAAEHQSPTQAQPRLPTLKLYLGPQEIVAELALTQKAVETGMMWRTNMPEMEGMLFAFQRPHRASFWMRNTLLPLSCAYIDRDGVILETHHMRPKDETPIEAQSDNVRYVLEMNQGWFERHQVGVGAVVRTERGSLGQTFFGER
jgi:uncharacterized membrane protein (UPF0127 family)